MSKTSLYRFTGSLVAFFLTLVARGSADPIPSRVIEVPNAPVVVSRCSYDPADYGMGRANVMNRSAHSLLSVTIRFQFFDEEGVIGQALFQASPGDMLASGDSSLFTDQLNKPFSDPDGVLRYTTCRVESATFTRGRTWRYGQHYSEKLLPVAVEHGHTGSPDSLAPERQGDGPSIGSNATSPSLVAKIGQFWMTNVPANLPNPGSFVHVRVTLNSPSVLDVSPADFRIRATLI